MANNDLTAKIRIDGDASGAAKAAEDVEKSLAGISTPAEKVNAQLRAMAAAADGFEVPAAAAESVGKLGQETGKAATSVADLAKKETALAAETGAAAAKFNDLKGKLEASSAAEKTVAAGANSINAAFATLNIRSADKIKADLLAVDQALVKLASSGKVSGADFDRAFAAGQQKIAGLKAELAAAEGQGNKFSASVAGIGNSLKGLAAPIAGAAIAHEFVQANVAAESLQRTLVQLTGSGEAAAAEIDYLKATSNRLGLSLEDTGRAYISLTAAAKGTALEGAGTRQVFEAVAGSMAKLGKSSADTEGALQAVSQMMSKGVVSMEEWRQQLGERLPGAMQATADAAGVSVEQLNKMIESGKVLSTDLLPLMAVGLEKVYGTAGQAEGSVAAWNRLKNSISETMVFVGDSGVWQGLVSILDGLSTTVRGMTAGFEMVGVTLGNMAGLLTEVWSNPAKALDHFVEEQNAARDRIVGNLEKIKGATNETNAAQAKQAADEKQRTAETAESAAMKLKLAGAYEAITTAAGTAAEQSVKSAAARAEEGKTANALAQAFGNEAEKRTASLRAARDDAEALRDVAEKRSLEAGIAEAYAQSLEALAEAQGISTKAMRDAIDEANKSAEAKKAEADKTDAAARAAEQHAAKLALESAALADNSGRVGELRAAHEAAAAALEQTRLAHERGTATLAQVRQAELDAGQAAGLYRDALADLTTKIEAKSRVEQAGMDVVAAGIKLQIAQVDSQYQVAKAYGDEAAAAAFLMQKKQLEIELAALTAKAKRAEAEAAILSAQARRTELEASGELTVAKNAELKAQEAAAQVKQIEAQIAEETASRMRDLALATDESAASSGRATDGFGGLANQLRDVAGAADGAAAAIDRASTSSEGVRGPGERVSGVDVKSVLYKYGASVDEAKLAEKYYGELYQREAATRLTGNLGTDANAAYQTNLAQKYSAEEALRLARQELASGKAVDLGTPVADLIAKNRATGNIGLTSLGGENNLIKDIKYAGIEAKASGVAAAQKETQTGQTNIYKVEISSGKDLFSVNTASAYDANALIDALKAMQSVSAI